MRVQGLYVGYEGILRVPLIRGFGFYGIIVGESDMITCLKKKRIAEKLKTKGPRRSNQNGRRTRQPILRLAYLRFRICLARMSFAARFYRCKLPMSFPFPLHTLCMSLCIYKEDLASVGTPATPCLMDSPTSPRKHRRRSHNNRKPERPRRHPQDYGPQLTSAKISSKISDYMI